MAETKAKLNFVQIPQSLYDGLTTKASNTLYFCPDTQRIHLGDKTMSRPVQIVSKIPAQRVAGNIYYCDGSLYYDNGSEAKSVSGEQDLFDEYSNSTSTSVKKISQEYLPDIQFQGKPLKDSSNKVVSGIGRSINFIGIGDVTVDDNGNITVRLGENLNSSEFGKTDGTTNGTCKVSTGIPSTYNSLTGNVDAKCIVKSTTNVVKFVTNGEIHLVGEEKFVVKITDSAKNTTSYSVGPIKLSDFITNEVVTKTEETYTSNNGGVVTLGVTSFGVEANSDKGATDYSASIAFSVDFAKISGIAQGYISVEITQDEKTGKYTGNNLFYYVTDTTTPSTTVTLTETKTEVTTSGLTSLTAYTVACKAETNGMMTPASAGDSKGYIYFDVTGSWSSQADKEVSITLGSAASYNSTLNFPVNDGIQTGIKVGAKSKNINGYGPLTEKEITGTYLVDKHTTGTTDDLNEAFDNESYRLTEEYAAWTSSTSLVDTDAVGKTALMVFGGKLQYPTGDYSGCDNGKGLTQPNYDDCSGIRKYIRKFTKTGSLGGGSLTIGHDAISGATLKSAIDGGSLKIEVAKNTHDKWYDVTKLVKDGGIGTGFGYGSNDSTSATISFAFTDGTSASDVYVRITLTKGSTVKLTSIVADLA